jgi:hypothetical protein
MVAVCPSLELTIKFTNVLCVAPLRADIYQKSNGKPHNVRVWLSRTRRKTINLQL